VNVGVDESWNQGHAEAVNDSGPAHTQTAEYSLLVEQEYAFLAYGDQVPPADIYLG
jgi:hypothetical protein